jgi:hypothetical protein
LPEFTITTPAPPHSDLIRRGPPVQPPPPYYSQRLPLSSRRHPPRDRPSPPLSACSADAFIRSTPENGRPGGRRGAPDCRSTGAAPGKFSGLTPSPAPRSATPEFVATRFIYSDWLGGHTLYSKSLIPSNLFSAFVYMIINPR